MCLTEEQKRQNADRQQMQAAPRQEELLQNGQQNQVLREAEAQRLQAEQAALGQETRLEEAQANEALVAEVRQELETAQAVRTAEGVPVQEQEPAPSTWKERREERKKAEAARKVCPEATATTYDMVEQLKKRKKVIQNSLNPYLELDGAQGEAGRCMRAFCKEYRTNRFGFPASEEDKRRKRENERFLRDYCTNNRREHLNRIVDEVINTRFSLNMFTPYNLRHNLAELKSLAERLTYIENLKRDNQAYFEELRQMNPDKWRKFDAVDQFGPHFVSLLLVHCQANGVDVNAADYFDSNQTGAIRFGRMSLETSTENFRRELKEYHWNSVYEPYANELQQLVLTPREELRQLAVAHAEHMRQAGRTFERLKTDSRLGIPPEELAPEAVKKSISVLVPDEAHAEENIRTIRLMQELEQNKDQRPSVDLYVRTRAFAAPIVQRVLDYPLDNMLELPVDSLIKNHAEELDKLAREGGLASGILRLQHPVYTADGNSRLMLQDELLGSKGIEFSYKCAMVQALAKKVRMFSLLANGNVENMRIGEEYLTQEERLEAGDIPEFMIGQRLLEAEEEMQAAKKKYQDVRTPGTEEYERWVQDIVERGRLNREVIDIKFEPVRREFLARETPEIQQAMDRLQFKSYYSLEYTAEQTKALGMPEDIAEPLFRSFDAFLKKEAVKKLLSPEELRRMFLDLGAGARMHCGPWESREVENRVDADGRKYSESKLVQHPGTPKEELEPAARKNRAGLAVYKRIMRAQYDMITRKYGLSLENLDMEDIVKYCSDFFRDFGDSQVEYHMLSRFPGFLDPEDEEDQLLLNQVKYYSMLGGMVNAMYAQLDARQNSMYYSAIQSKDDIRQFMQYVLDDPDIVEAKEYLLSHSRIFHHENIDPLAQVRTAE